VLFASTQQVSTSALNVFDLGRLILRGHLALARTLRLHFNSA
jgi:hypothetical protein